MIIISLDMIIRYINAQCSITQEIKFTINTQFCNPVMAPPASGAPQAGGQSKSNEKKQNNEITRM